VWSTKPALMAWGLLPGVIAFAVIAAALATIAFNASEWGDRLSSGIVNSTSSLAWVMSLAIAIGIFAGSLLIAVYTFTALTLFIGQPFFERISHSVDGALGEPEVVDAELWWRATLRGLAEAVRLLVLSVVVGAGLWVMSLIPVVGSGAALVLCAMFGGWILALELTAYPLSRRGVVTLKDRRSLLGHHRPLVVGFGATVFVLFLLPFGAVIAMPAAVVGATLVTRRLLGEADTGNRPAARIEKTARTVEP
jgi:CysZ protein